MSPASSPVIAVGGVAVDSTPVWLKDFAIRTFGTHDKQLLIGGVLVVLAVYAGAVGIVAHRRLRLGLVGVGLFALIGAAAALTRPAAGGIDVLPSIVGGVAGVLALP